MRAAFLIKSPLQLLNAIEAREHFEYEGEECLLVLIADRKSLPQLEKLVLADGSWPHILMLSDAPLFPKVSHVKGRRDESRNGVGLFRNDLFAIWKLLVLANSLQCLEKVFVGDIGNPLIRHFANCVQQAEVVVLDDGTATLNYSSIRYGAHDVRKKQSVSKMIKLFFKRNFMGLRDQEIERITFFTVYKLETKAPDTYIRHEYPCLRSSVEQLVRENEIYFLGSPLVEAGILSEVEFFTQLEEVQRRLNDKNVIYVAHRRELQERVQMIGRKLGWTTCIFDYPIEYQLARIGPRPRQLASFFSSALENCQKIFGADLPIISFRLNSGAFSLKDSPKGKQVANLYEHYKSLENDSFIIVSL